MIIVLALLLISSSQIPVEYGGWINNCSFYFQSNPVNNQTAQQQFLQCHAHVCQQYYLMSCDKYMLVKNSSLEGCMKLCCNEQTNFSQFTSILSFLQQCQMDFLFKKNSIMTSMNRLPLKVLVLTFFGLLILLIVCIGFAFSQEIMHWGRQRLSSGHRNEAGLQMRNFIN